MYRHSECGENNGIKEWRVPNELKYQTNSDA